MALSVPLSRFTSRVGCVAQPLVIKQFSTTINKLPSFFVYLYWMYKSDYYPRHVVDRLRDILKELVSFLESGEHTTTQVQDELDRVTRKINELQAVFKKEGSEIETVAREVIVRNIEDILRAYEIDIDTEEAIRAREW